MNNNIGFHAIEIYHPTTFVSQSALEKYDNASTGKYTIGLGQSKLSFTYPFEDINSICLTVVNRLLKNYNIHPSQIGRLEIGTETLIDKSKSTKTVLMTLFEGYNDIEGATSINACYGATNALFNAYNWISSEIWDGRYAIVVAADIAVYEKGPARPTGGAGAIAMLLGRNAKISIDPIRSTFIDHQYDFYKPNPGSEYPTVDGSLSISCYLGALQQCLKTIKAKYSKIGKQFNINDYKYVCFHSPFHKMVQKAFIKLMQLQNKTLSEQEILKLFKQKVEPGMLLSKNLGNIYTGSLYSGLISLFLQPNLKDTSVLMFSYGSGLMSSLFSVRFHQNCEQFKKITNIQQRLAERIEICPVEYSRVMLEKEVEFGKLLPRKLEIKEQFLGEGVFYLAEIDNKWRRRYQIKSTVKKLNIKKESISNNKYVDRIEHLQTQIVKPHVSGYHKLPPLERIQILEQDIGKTLDKQIFQTSRIKQAEVMVENVIGLVSMPLGIIRNMVINKKSYQIPACIEQPSIIAACSSIGKLISPYSFFTSSTQNIMVGQVHLPNCQKPIVHYILSEKHKILKYLSTFTVNLQQRGGGIEDLRVRHLDGKDFVAEIVVNVCEAMGANKINTLCQELKAFLERMKIQTGIAVLTNYCSQRTAMSWFEMPIRAMHWKDNTGKIIDGFEVAKKILEAYEFARLDKYRATTHNKGIMNGIDSVCLATGQDFRAIQAAAHVHAMRTGKYMPLTHYEYYFKGTLQLPISVGTVGGALQKNPLYKATMEILNKPTARQFSEILVSVGLAQNFGALRALAVQGIQAGHMTLHSRAIAAKAGVPDQFLQEACRYMKSAGKYDINTAKKFIESIKPKL